jgi:hypothetical protein
MDGPVDEKLFQASLIDRFAPPFSPLVNEQPREERFNKQSRKLAQGAGSFMTPKSRLSRERRTDVSGPSMEDLREVRFSSASQKLTKDRPALMQRMDASWDVRAVLESYRAKEKQARERTAFSEQCYD